MKPKTIFQLISCVFENKTPWEDLSEQDKKTFSPYMMNRFISMSMDYAEVIDYLQLINIETLPKREAYKLYLEIFPPRKFWAKYIKADSKTSKNSEYPNDSLISFVAKQEEWSKKETEENLILLFNTNVSSYIHIMNDYLDLFGIDTDSKVKKYGILPF